MHGINSEEGERETGRRYFGQVFFFVGLQSASVSDRLLLCDEFPRDRFVPMTGKGSFGRALPIGGQKINPKHSHVKPAASKSTVAER